MREAIEQYVVREEKREALHQDVLQAWQEYEETGLHITGDEAIAWLQTWRTEGEKEAPQCHVRFFRLQYRETSSDCAISCGQRAQRPRSARQ